MSRKKKIFGTGAVITEEKEESQGSSVTPGWADAVSERSKRLEGVQNINSKTLPVDVITLDPGNPRQLVVTREGIESLIEKKPLPANFSESADWVEAYALEATKSLAAGKRAVKELTTLLRFASSLGSADRLINPIAVYPHDGVYRVAAGERRLLVCLLLGASYAPVRIFDQRPEELELLLLQWSENEEREDLRLFEKLENLKRIISAWKTQTGKRDVSVREFASKTGMGKTTAQRYLSVIKHASKSLWESINSGKVNSIVLAHNLCMESKNPKEIPKQATLKFSKGEDISGIGFMVQATADKLEDPTLAEHISKLKLGDEKELKTALNLVFEFFGETEL